jgi:transposase
MICKVQCKLQCCVTPPKPVKRAEKRAQKTRNAKYSLPYTIIAERHSMSVLQSIGKNKKEIASILHVSKSTVKRQMKKFKQTGSFMDKEKKGRPSKFTDEISAQLVAWVEEDRRCTSSKLSTMVKEQFDVDISERTIRTFSEDGSYD